MQSLYLRGEDVGETTYWAWEWLDGLTPPAFVAVPRADVADQLRALDEALPGMLSSEAELSREETDAIVAQRLPAAVGAIMGQSNLPERANPREDAIQRELVMVARCLTGALVDRDRERELFTVLGRALLPEGFLSTLRERVEEHGVDGVEVRVLPAPSAVRVPWDLLVTGNPDDPDERLLDLARVVTMAPLLGRDGDSSVPHPDWGRVQDEPPLWIIDPKAGRAGSVLSKTQHRTWTERVGTAELPTDQIAVAGERLSRLGLAELLSRPRSRFVYVGHVMATEATQGKTALVLDDRKSIYGLGKMDGGIRPFTAQDLVAGTVGFDAHQRALGASWNLSFPEALEAEYGSDIVFPVNEVDQYGVPVPVLGRDIWHMPPRAALIACHSGADYTHAEPFGLVSAILDIGATMVIATRWVLLTDRVFEALGGGEPLQTMALAADDMLQAEDPLAELVRWQRARLAAWRAHGTLADSPLTWGSLSITDAPDRTDRPE